MLSTYMVIWSVVIVLMLGVTRLRKLSHLLIVAFVTGMVLFVSQTIFEQLALTMGLAPMTVWFDPMSFLQAGPLGWLALLIMPCGWLGPILGLHLVERYISPVINQYGLEA